MNTCKLPRWVDFVVSELSIEELEDFEKMLKKAISEKNRVLFEQPLCASPRKFRGIKIEDSNLTIRTKNLLMSRKYRTLEQIARLSRNQIFSILRSTKLMIHIIYELADDKTIGAKDSYESLKLKLNMDNTGS